MDTEMREFYVWRYPDEEKFVGYFYASRERAEAKPEEGKKLYCIIVTFYDNDNKKGGKILSFKPVTE